MLIAQLWSGIASPRLQDATRHAKQLMGSFNEFQREVRVVEKQIGLSGASSRAQAHQGQVSVSELEKLRGTMHSLEKKLDRMSVASLQQTVFSSQPSKVRLTLFFQPQSQGPDGYQMPPPSDGRSPHFFQRQRQGPGIRTPRATGNGYEVICHRCRQPGHIAIGCRVCLDHLN